MGDETPIQVLHELNRKAQKAFLKLESENLVVTIPRRGTFVKKLSANEIKEYYQIRLAMENLAVELILKNGFFGRF